MRRLCRDADLGCLAIEPQRYREYSHLIYSEYAHLPLLSYLRTRTTIVRKLLARDRLFASPLGQHWERPARENLEAELRRLSRKRSICRRTTTLSSIWTVLLPPLVPPP